MKVLNLAVVCLIGLAVDASSSAAGMYKWVDEKGMTHYGDSIPTQYLDRGNQQLNTKGVVVKTTAAALTAEQRSALRREQEVRKTDELQAKEQKRRDDALLLTFTSVEEIDRKRDRDLQQVELAIANAEAVIHSLEQKLEEQNKRADTIAKRGKPVPEPIKEDIAGTEAEKQAQQALIARKREEYGAVRAKYETYRSRYTELKSGVAAR